GDISRLTKTSYQIVITTTTGLAK
ncbi:unnamed protein product, partial [Rotaria sordida]